MKNNCIYCGKFTDKDHKFVTEESECRYCGISLGVKDGVLFAYQECDHEKPYIYKDYVCKKCIYDHAPD